MQAQHTSVFSNTEEQALVELDLEILVHVGGGTPKGTWNEESVAAAAVDTDPTPKGTW
ncbi:hypothetical protein [Roseateles depolymerans]|uniref:Uncharacterized protein n=1 Tax=Roseateles depolymerans TaxID=76731 RepID=A0A0U3M7S0_9BURK|nr:hypothetical protein [Roseateles depolymerans]ALV04621.1 hypothetical protein RD2015_116 [Roseateles depolymerans]REG14154.1 hypothetical protein DES44_4167 [Roseateles depolymerans]